MYAGYCRKQFRESAAPCSISAGSMPSNIGPSPIMSLSSCISDLEPDSSQSEELFSPCRDAKPAGADLKRGCGEAELAVAETS